MWRPFDPREAPGSETQRNIIQYSTVLRWPGMAIFSLTEIFMRLILLNWCHCLGMHVTAICLFCHCFMKHPTSVFRYQMRVGHSGYKLGDMVVFNLFGIGHHLFAYKPIFSHCLGVGTLNQSQCVPPCWQRGHVSRSRCRCLQPSPAQPSPAQPAQASPAYTQ